MTTKHPRIIITCQHNKIKDEQNGDIKGTDTARKLGKALSDMIKTKAALASTDAKFVNVLFTNTTLSSCDLGVYSDNETDPFMQPCEYAPHDGIVKKVDEMFASDKDEIVWILDLHTFIATETTGWFEFDKQVVFLFSQVTPASQITGDAADVMLKVNPKHGPLTTLIMTKQRNCVVDRYQSKTKCVVLDFSVDPVMGASKDTINAVADVISDDFLANPIVLKFTEGLILGNKD